MTFLGQLEGRACLRLAAAAAASLLASSYGLAIGWAVVANWQLQLERPGEQQLLLSPWQRSWVLSALYAGVAAGCVIGGRLGSWLGPRSMLLASVPTNLAAGAVIFFAPSFEVLTVGRVLSGLGVGMVSAVYMLYISGTSRPEERGLVSTFCEVAIVSGTLLSVAAGQALSWRWLAVLCALLCTVPSTALLALLPSDPVWLLSQGQTEEAQRSADLFGLELYKMTASGAGQDGAGAKSEPVGWRETLRQLTKRRNLAPLALVISLFFFRAFSGYYGILAYSLEFFREAGLELDASLSSILFGGVTVLAAMVASLLIDRLGRRPLLLASAAATGLCYLGLVLLYHVPALISVPALPAALLLTAGFMFYMGLGCVPYCLVGELFPVRIRPLGSWLVPVSYCAFSSGALLLFPPTVAALGPSGMFLCHAAAMATAFGLVLLALPETRGLPLADVETLFERPAAGGENDQKTMKPAPKVADGHQSAEENRPKTLKEV